MRIASARKLAGVTLAVLVTALVPIVTATPALAVTFSFSSGVMTITGGPANDVVSVQCISGTLHAGSDSTTPCGSVQQLVVKGLGGNDQISLGAVTSSSFPAMLGCRLVGGSGIDDLQSSSFNDVVLGGGGGDILRPQHGHDVLDGGSGSDELYSTDAADQTVTNTSYVGLGHATLRSIERLSLGSGSGNDRIDASRWTIRGPVSLDGGAGDDTIIGSPQADSLSGEDGKDVLRGGGGNDQLQPDASPVPDDDTIAGGPGRDQLNALIYNSGNIKYGKASVGGLDTFTSIESVVAYPNYTFGGPLNFDSSTFTGDVSVQGTALADVIETGSGDDRFTSGNGADSFAAHGGNDEMSVLLAGGGSVNVSASAVNSTSAGIKSISGVNHVDVYGDATAQSFGSSAFPGTVRFNGVGGNDVVNGNGPGTTYELDGAAGPVVITNGGISATGSTIGFTNVGGVIVSLVAPGTIDAHAFGGKAQLYGTTGVDTLTGTDHADRLAGFAGDDTLKGQAGDDILWGSSGQDVFRGGPGQDRCDNKASEDATSCEGKAPPLPT